MRLNVNGISIPECRHLTVTIDVSDDDEKLGISLISIRGGSLIIDGTPDCPSLAIVVEKALVIRERYGNPGISISNKNKIPDGQGITLSSSYPGSAMDAITRSELDLLNPGWRDKGIDINDWLPFQNRREAIRRAKEERLATVSKSEIIYPSL